MCLLGFFYGSQKFKIMKNNKKIILSIIIPVFNSKNYLLRCVNSFIKENMRSVEVILVDDGSTDGSSQICDSLAHQYTFIKVKHIRNSGVSTARNVGLENANGKWIAWIDSDDTVREGYIEVVKQLIKLDYADIYQFHYETGNNFKKEKKVVFDKSKLLARSKSTVMADLPRYEFGNYLWCRIFKKELFSNIKFPDKNNCEDAAVMVDICEKANSFYLYDAVLYYYWDNDNSFSSHQNMLRNPLLLRDWFVSNKNLMDKLKKRGYFAAYNYSKTEVLKIAYTITKAVDFEGIESKDIYEEANTIVNNYKYYINEDTSLKERCIFFLRHYNYRMYKLLMHYKYQKSH